MLTTNRLGGYETTANAIIYGIIVLALHPDLQEHVIAEIDRIYQEAELGGRKELSYAIDFKKLEYTYGFMVHIPPHEETILRIIYTSHLQYEILRLFPGVIHITKMVTAGGPSQIIHTSDAQGNESASHILPSGCRVYLNSTGTHYHPKYWPNPYNIDPTRWMTAPPTNNYKNSSSSDSNMEKNGKDISFLNRTTQMRGTFLTFSDAARKCLGKNFAQAEFMALFTGMLRRYRVRLGEGVDGEAVERDLYRCCAGSVTLAPLYDVNLRLEPRTESGSGGE